MKTVKLSSFHLGDKYDKLRQDLFHYMRKYTHTRWHSIQSHYPDIQPTSPSSTSFDEREDQLVHFLRSGMTSPSSISYTECLAKSTWYIFKVFGMTSPSSYFLCWTLSERAATIFKVFGMTRLGIEPESLAYDKRSNSLTLTKSVLKLYLLWTYIARDLRLVTVVAWRRWPGDWTGFETVDDGEMVPYDRVCVWFLADPGTAAAPCQ